MDSRRLVVWISTGIPGFQGAIVAFDLLNGTALSWLDVRVNGLPALEPRVDPLSGSTPVHPLALFCARPQGRIDDAVNQGLNILAGLALRSSVNGRGIDER